MGGGDVPTWGNNFHFAGNVKHQHFVTPKNKTLFPKVRIFHNVKILIFQPSVMVNDAHKFISWISCRFVM